MLLFRYPGLVGPLAVGALLLALTAAAQPLFVGASAGALLRAEISRPLITRYGAGLSYSSTRVPLRPTGDRPPLYERRETAFAEGASRSPLLGPTVSQVLGPEVSVSSTSRSGQPIQARLFAGTDALSHVDVISGEPGPGAWLPDLVANALDAGPGDVVTVARGEGTTRLEVAGTYRSLYTQPSSGYWLPWESEIYPYCPPGRDCVPAPPQFVLLSRDAAFASYRHLGTRSADFAWTAPVADAASFTREEATTLSRFVEAFQREASRRSTTLGRILRCCTEANMYGSRFGPQVGLSSEAGHVLDRVDARLVTVEGPARLIQILGGILALAILGGAAAFAASARTTEVQLLSAQGRGPLMVAAKAAIENIVPSVAGGVAGVALAFLLIRWMVPGAIGPEAIRTAALGAIAAVSVSIVIGSVVAALMARVRFGPRAATGRILLWIPWELPLLAFALVALRDLRANVIGVSISDLGQRPPNASLFLLPLLALGGFAVLGARLFRVVGARLASRSDRMRPAAYLAVHRLADSRGLVLLLFAAAALSMGIFIEGQTVSRSLADTVDTKAGLFVGSDVQAAVAPDTEVPADFPLPATKVTRLPAAGTMEPLGDDFDLIAVDPRTVAAAAAWHDGLAHIPLRELVGRLPAGPAGPSPVIVVGRDLPAVTSVEIKGRRIGTVTVGRALAFPGMMSSRPTIVVDRSVLERTSEGALGALDDVNAQTELWVRGDTGRAVAALRQLPDPPYATLTLERVKDIPYISAVIDMFGILNAVGLGAAFLVVAALAMYLQARARSQLVAYGLSTRMGMGHRTHRRSLVLEALSILGSSSAIGISLALAMAFVLVPPLDPIKAVPPEPLLVPPLPAIVLGIAGLAACSWGAAWLTEARARRAVLGEVLRVD